MRSWTSSCAVSSMRPVGLPASSRTTRPPSGVAEARLQHAGQPHRRGVDERRVPRLLPQEQGAVTRDPVEGREVRVLPVVVAQSVAGGLDPVALRGARGGGLDLLVHLRETTGQGRHVDAGQRESVPRRVAVRVVEAGQDGGAVELEAAAGVEAPHVVVEAHDPSVLDAHRASARTVVVHRADHGVVQDEIQQGGLRACEGLWLPSASHVRVGRGSRPGLLMRRPETVLA